VIAATPLLESHAHLSPRLVQVVGLAADGMTDKEIARALGVSPSTVDFHWKRLRTIYDGGTRTGIVVRVLRQLHNLAPRSGDDATAASWSTAI
jgi:DNA-binding CsgD family transcriptional regulator